MEATGLSTLLTSVGEVFNAFIGYVGDVCEAIVTNPLLLLGASVGLTFSIVGFVKKLK